MARLTALQTSLAGLTPAFAAAADGDIIGDNDEKKVLHVKNASGAGVTVTVRAATSCSHNVLHDAAAVVPAASERIIGPFRRDRFGSEPVINYSAVTGVTAAVLRTSLA